MTVSEGLLALGTILSVISSIYAVSRSGRSEDNKTKVAENTAEIEAKRQHVEEWQALLDAVTAQNERLQARVAELEAQLARRPRGQR